MELGLTFVFLGLIGVIVFLILYSNNLMNEKLIMEMELHEIHRREYALRQDNTTLSDELEFKTRRHDFYVNETNNIIMLLRDKLDNYERNKQ